MVISLRAGCRAALSLWILSSFICRAWTAPSSFLLTTSPS
ncbi:rCG28052 [Rattus norvegicus]|uniref:RCG28052 n=1 Tax=Rattus norvegicus TaxID=10116 RepID=A6IFB2_RAT|nr:rCG28052 [Rattus norvegicus]